ncbi:SDR family oxidoreductase [Actinoplanes solisilvae]|uniref:SDR family oxidoreductase n=1 Tax=Actinoplanes solisilvae TaxID=2486853 RepID=UPI000FDC5998|nr:SDR family oxidoreductase [Actinoplanes solisilvae]
MRNINGSTAFVSGGQRGIGRAIAEELLRRGATKVYVSARDPRPEADPRLVPVPLDVTDPGAAAGAAKLADDVSIVVNNAGVGGAQPLTTTDLDHTRTVFETNVFGAIEVARAFAPVLKANGGGTLVNTLSALSWLSGAGAYGASKAALWSVTNSLRKELRGQGTNVIGVHVGYVDTDMTRHVSSIPKISTQEVAQAVADGIEAEASEVLVDEVTRRAKVALSGAPEDLEL